MGVLSNSVWPNAAFLCAALLGGAFIGTLLATRYRSRRILLISQAAMLALYSGFLVILCGVVLQPTAVDAKVRLRMLLGGQWEAVRRERSTGIHSPTPAWRKGLA